MPASTANTLTSNQQTNLISTPIQSTVTVDSNLTHISSLPSSTVIATTTATIPGTIQAIGKADNVKQINICVTPGLNSGTNLNSNNVTVAAAANAAGKFQAQTVSTNYYNTSNCITTTATSIPVGTLQSLGLMVTRFANDPTSRHQTVLTLHPRPVNPNARTGNVVVTTSTGVQSIRAVTNLPINTAGRVSAGGHTQLASPASTIQVMNLSVTNPSGGALASGNANNSGYTTGTVKQICQPAGRFITSTLPIESLELVVTNDGTSSGRQIRIPPEVNIVNVKPSTAAGVISSAGSGGHSVAKLTRTSLVTSNQAGKMINIHTSGHANTANISPQVTRLGIIGQIPSSAVVTTASGTKSILNTLTLAKPVQILNPSSNVNSANIINPSVASITPVHGVVNLSNVSQISSGPIVSTGGTLSGTVASNQIRSNPTVMTLANLSQTRQVLTTSNPIQQTTFLTAQSKTPSNITVQQQQHSPLSNSLTIGAPANALRPNILSSPISSPVKQNQTHLTIPQSPRPSILIRKKIINESGNINNKLANINSGTAGTITINNQNNSICKIVSSKNLLTSSNTNELTSKSPLKRANDKDMEILNNNSNNNNKQQLNSTTIVTMTTNASATAATMNNSESTPRKKPRKQLLEPFNLSTSVNIKLLSGSSSSSSIDEQVRVNNVTAVTSSLSSSLNAATHYSHSYQIGQVNNDRENMITINNNNNGNNTEIREGIITICKKPRPSLLPSYSSGWKSLQYHFLRYSDVKQRAEKKQTLSELSNEGLQRKNGWKIHHLGTQMDDISENEANIYERLNQLLDHFENNTQYAFINTASKLNNNSNHDGEKNNKRLTNNKNIDELTSNKSINNLQLNQCSLLDKLNDLIKGNLQRSHLFQEQICESKQLLIRLTNDHKERVGKLTKKCANKRTFITK